MNQPDTDNGNRREPAFNIPTVVVVLIFLCTGIHLVRTYLLTAEQDLSLIVHYSFIPVRYDWHYAIDIYAFISPVTYSFLHGGLLHLAINMIWLAAFGSPLAYRVGTVRFLGFWAFTAAAAAGFHFLLHADEAVPVIGASGAVSGLMAAAARFGFSVDRSGERTAFAGQRLGFAQMLQTRMVVVFLVIWMVVNLIAGSGLLISEAGQSVAWEAHIGGFVAGLFGLALFDRPSRSKNS